ncbi:MAG: hypothetical protein E3J72_16770 [Planctomycetota bacterium]|nr:MAG: hypothetical protein E3J72_16770 [Planctomycetota bacterium]
MRLGYLLISIGIIIALTCFTPACSSNKSGNKVVTGTATGSTGGGNTTGGGTTGGGGSTGSGDGSINGGDTGNDAGNKIFTVKDMFDYLNYKREIYAGTGGHGTAPHGGFDGYPWEGENLPESQPYTWSITFTWDSELAKEAQGEAERLRDGGSPVGRRFKHQSPIGGEPMWLEGLDAPKYMASGFCSPDTAQYAWWKTNNGTARMALHYQTGTAPYNHKTKLGIGKADTGDNDIWWVFLYGE